ncbi:MAG: hypothetical protein ACXQS2_05025, partial [Methermicoccaceae archaeon]
MMQPLLSSNEKKVLKVIRDKPLPIEVVAEYAGISPEATLQAGYMLAEKGLAEVHPHTITTFSLTEEGHTYAKEG